MNKNLLLLLGLAIASGSISAMQNERELCHEYLRKKYQAPAELAARLDAAYKQNKDFKQCIKSSRVCKCPDNLPCYIKTIYGHNMDRLRKLDKLRTFFDQENLDELILPEKYLWRDMYLVAEELAPEKNSHDECTLDGITKKTISTIANPFSKGRIW